MKFLSDNGLTLTLLIVTMLCIVGMVGSGLQVENEMLASHGQPLMSVAEYVASGSFLSALFENWESEFLQMAAYVMLTATLFQRGSAESRDPDKPERDGDELPSTWLRRHLALQWLYAHSLGLALTALFFASFVAHGLGIAAAASQEAVLHDTELKTPQAELWNARTECA